VIPAALRWRIERTEREAAVLRSRVDWLEQELTNIHRWVTQLRGDIEGFFSACRILRNWHSLSRRAGYQADRQGPVTPFNCNPLWRETPLPAEAVGYATRWGRQPRLIPKFDFFTSSRRHRPLTFRL